MASDSWTEFFNRMAFYDLMKFDTTDAQQCDMVDLDMVRRPTARAQLPAIKLCIKGVRSCASRGRYYGTCHVEGCGSSERLCDSTAYVYSTEAIKASCLTE